MIKLLNRIQIKIVFTLMLMAIVSQYTSLEVSVLVSVGVMALTLIPAYSVGSVARDEVMSRIFSRDLQEQLWPENTFFSGCQVDTGITTDQTSIEIPQDEDGEAETIINPTQFPLTVYEEEDTKKSYGTDLIATKPQLVTDLNQALTSYDKRASKLRKHRNTLMDKSAMIIAYGWVTSKSDFRLPTTGSATRPGSAPGAEGDTKKKVAFSDILKLMTIFNKNNIPVGGRRILMNAETYEDFFNIEEIISMEKLRAPGDLSEGSMGRVMGFEIFMRSEVPSVAVDGTKKAYGAASAADDAAPIIAYHPDFVRYGEGIVDVYINPRQGQYLGGTMNAAIRTGSTISRISERGVAMIYEAAG